jgi:hypothetical protein
MVFKIHYYLLLIFTLLIGSCSTFKWQPTAGRSATLPYTFDRLNILGNGLKITDQGYQTISCLKSFKATTSKGLLDLKFFQIDKNYLRHDSQLDQFIQKSLKNVQKFNQSEQEPFSFILVITIKDRLTAIQEETVEFQEDITQLISSHNKEKFYDTCGTDFIETVTFDNEVYFFFSYYPQNKSKAELLKKKIISKMTRQENDIHKINIFKELAFSSDSYFSLQATTDRFLKPIEFPFQEYHGKDIDVFLNDLLTTVVNSNYGQVTSYSTSPWVNLNSVRNITPLNGRFMVKGYSDETIYKTLLLLEDSIRQFKIWHQRVIAYLGQNQNHENTICRDQVTSSASIINWQNYQSCRQTVIEKQSIDLGKLESCQALVQAISKLNQSQNCLFADKEIISLPVKEAIQDYKPTELMDHVEKNNLFSPKLYFFYRFNDKGQHGNIPKPVPLGTGADRSGKIYDESCIIEESKKYTGELTNRIQTVSSDYIPFSTETWPWWKRFFLFWQDSPQWTRFRGSFEIRGLSDMLIPNFKLIPELEILSKKDLAGFFQRCGTHYVNQVENRRGFVYYFEPQAPEIEAVEITVYGLTPPELSDIITHSPQIKPEEKENQENQTPCEVCFEVSENGEPSSFELPSPKVFFHQKSTLINHFKNDRAAIPARLSLIPWTDYLLNRGFIKRSQLTSQRPKP